MTTNGGTLTWKVKESLLTYLSEIGDVSVETHHGAHGDVDQGFSFAVSTITKPAPGLDCTVTSDSEAVVSGYGMVMFVIAQPSLEIQGDTARLFVRRWADRDDRLPLAMATGAPTRTKGAYTWEHVTLTEEGGEIFNFQYNTGSTLAPLTLTLPS